MRSEALPPVKQLAAHQAYADFRVRLGWPVQVDAGGHGAVLLTGEGLTAGPDAGSRVVVVDTPADLGSRVSSVLWMRSLPAVVLAARRLLYVHPYRLTRWLFVAVADDTRRFEDPRSLPAALLDIEVIRRRPVPLPPLRDRRAGSARLDGFSWVHPPAVGDVQARVLPRLTSVLAAAHEVVVKGAGPAQRSP